MTGKRSGSWRRMAAGVLSVLLVGCGSSLTNLFDDDFLRALGIGEQVATLPGDAPGLLVTLENVTEQWVSMVVAYRDSDDQAQIYTSTIAPATQTAQMLVCPISEITIGDVSGLDQSGVRVYLADLTGVADPNSIPYIEVEPFGSLLQEGINYDCGDGLTFTVQRSLQTRSGYQLYAYIRRAGS
jgi:hypothetical protein